MKQGEIVVETQELKDYSYIANLNNDLYLFPNLRKTDQYKSHDAEYLNGIIEIKERCTTDRYNPLNGESWAYSWDIFIEEHKLREFSKYKNLPNWKYINIFTASADTNEELIFVYDIREVVRKKLLNISKKPIYIQSMKGSDIPPHYEKRWLINTEKAIINKALNIFARSRTTGRYTEYPQEVYEAFLNKLKQKEKIMSRYYIPYDSKEERDLQLWNIFHN